MQSLSICLPESPTAGSDSVFWGLPGKPAPCWGLGGLSRAPAPCPGLALWGPAAWSGRCPRVISAAPARPGPRGGAGRCRPPASVSRSQPLALRLRGRARASEKPACAVTRGEEKPAQHTAPPLASGYEPASRLQEAAQPCHHGRPLPFRPRSLTPRGAGTGGSGSDGGSLSLQREPEGPLPRAWVGRGPSRNPVVPT